MRILDFLHFHLFPTLSQTPDLNSHAFSEFEFEFPPVPAIWRKFWNLAHVFTSPSGPCLSPSQPNLPYFSKVCLVLHNVRKCDKCGLFVLRIRFECHSFVLVFPRRKSSRSSFACVLPFRVKFFWDC